MSAFCEKVTQNQQHNPKYYPSIFKIKEKMNNKNMSFSFSFVIKETILNELRKLNLK